MHSGILHLGQHHTVSLLFLVEFLDFSEQIFHTPEGRTFLPVGGIHPATSLPKGLFLDVACGTSFWANVRIS